MESSWINGLMGGALIGLSAVAYLLLAGRVAGISGILRSALWGDADGRRGESVIFLTGLVAGAALVSHVLKMPQVVFVRDGLWLIPAGLLVGYGSALGSGCTSGHGICGLSRKSPRSLASTLTFMATAIVVVAVLRALGAA